MTKPRKQATVSKKVSDLQLKDHLRWQAFVKHCQIDWDSLSEEAKDFFFDMGSTETSEEELNASIDAAMMAAQTEQKEVV